MCLYRRSRRVREGASDTINSTPRYAFIKEKDDLIDKDVKQIQSEIESRSELIRHT